MGKTPVAGVKDRPSNKVNASVVESVDGPTLTGFVHKRTEPNAVVYTDEAAACRRLLRAHETVRHSMGEYVIGQAHTNGLESSWSMLKRGYIGIYHNMSVKHLDRYVAESQERGERHRKDARPVERHHAPRLPARDSAGARRSDSGAGHGQA